MDGYCAFCLNYGPLRLSHAIPRAAFTAMLAGTGNAIGIPYGDSNAHLTSDTGDAPLLCDQCEGQFNHSFDAPLINALKSLGNRIQTDGFRSSIAANADQLAHAVVSIAWRICKSPAKMYSEVKLSPPHFFELDRLLRSPTDSILRDCTVRFGRLADRTPSASGRFDQELMGLFLKMPQTYSLRTKPNGKFDRFAMDWTMFGFLVQLVVPRLGYPRSKNFGGLKRNSMQVDAVRVDMLQYPPLKDALVAGYAAQVEGRLSPSLKKRDANRIKE